MYRAAFADMTELFRTATQAAQESLTDTREHYLRAEELGHKFYIEISERALQQASAVQQYYGDALAALLASLEAPGAKITDILNSPLVGRVAGLLIGSGKLPVAEEIETLAKIFDRNGMHEESARIRKCTTNDQIDDTLTDIFLELDEAKQLALLGSIEDDEKVLLAQIHQRISAKANKPG
jgi:hypothetical protein